MLVCVMLCACACSSQVPGAGRRDASGHLLTADGGGGDGVAGSGVAAERKAVQRGPYGLGTRRTIAM